MKKYLLIGIALLYSFVITAQQTKQTSGVKDHVIVFDFVADTSDIKQSASLKTKTGEKYYIVPFAKKTAHELYNDILVRVAHLYKSHERVADKVEDRSIVINGYGSHITKQTSGGFRISVSYHLEFNFKDGKIKVYAPCFSSFDEVSMKTGQEFKNISGTHIWSLAQNNETEVIHQIEEYFNKLITDIVYGNPEDEDW